jgi:Glutamate dehydrogenase/leucine dehydrogenase
MYSYTEDLIADLAAKNPGEPEFHQAVTEAFGMPGNYVAGANTAGFMKVADAMMAQGIV